MTLGTLYHGNYGCSKGARLETCMIRGLGRVLLGEGITWASMFAGGCTTRQKEQKGARS